MGLERRMPAVSRDKLARRIRLFDPGQDSVLRFRHRNLVQRLIVLEQYWNRILRAMESGTYSRDIARANFREQRRSESPISKNKPTPERNAEAKKKAAAVGAEAEAFLAQMGMGASSSDSSESSGKSKPPLQLKMRGTPSSATQASPKDASSQTKGPPKLRMRGRSKREENQ